MTFQLTFEDTDKGKDTFTALWDGLRIGALMKGVQEKRDRERMTREAAVRRLLKAVSRDIAPVDDEDDKRALNDGGGTVMLSQPQKQMLLDYGWAVTWTPRFVEHAVDALEWLENVAPYAEPSTDDDV